MPGGEDRRCEQYNAAFGLTPLIAVARGRIMAPSHGEPAMTLNITITSDFICPVPDREHRPDAGGPRRRTGGAGRRCPQRAAVRHRRRDRQRRAIRRGVRGGTAPGRGAAGRLQQRRLLAVLNIVPWEEGAPPCAHHRHPDNTAALRDVPAGPPDPRPDAAAGPLENGIPDMRGQLDLAARADRLGFTTLWVRDVPLFDPQFNDAGQIYDPGSGSASWRR